VKDKSPLKVRSFLDFTLKVRPHSSLKVVDGCKLDRLDHLPHGKQTYCGAIKDVQVRLPKFLAFGLPLS
jgi:hypothetical protein